VQKEVLINRRAARLKNKNEEKRWVNPRKSNISACSGLFFFQESYISGLSCDFCGICVPRIEKRIIRTIRTMASFRDLKKEVICFSISISIFYIIPAVFLFSFFIKWTIRGIIGYSLIKQGKYK